MNDKIILPMSLPSHILSPISSQYGGSVYDIYVSDLNIFLNLRTKLNLHIIMMNKILKIYLINKIIIRKMYKESNY